MNERIKSCLEWQRRWDDAEGPHTSPTAISEPMQAMVVWARKRHPRVAPWKLRAWLLRLYPAREFPSASAPRGAPRRGHGELVLEWKIRSDNGPPFARPAPGAAGSGADLLSPAR